MSGGLLPGRPHLAACLSAKCSCMRKQARHLASSCLCLPAFLPS